MPLCDTKILSGKLAPQSLAGYERDLRGYLRFCDDPDAALEPFNLARWCVHLAQATPLMSPNTINRKLAAIKSLIRESAMQGYIPHATAEAFRRVPGVPLKAMKDRLKVPTRITPARMRILCDVPQRTTLIGWRDRALLHTLASSGLRVSEAITLQPEQLVSRDGGFFLEAIMGKNQTEARVAPLSHEAFAAVQAWLARRPMESAFVFTRMGGKGTTPTVKPLDRSSVWRIVARYASQTGLQHVSPHSFRRFVGTELARKDIRQAQKALGHARIETTAKHYVLDDLAGGLTDSLF